MAELAFRKISWWGG